ncbi:MAG: hypothetical protein IPK16_30395 [Anaerolineales bacterium]|nr:hypothetical protein [Anaerolineales bacterium]
MASELEHAKNDDRRASGGWRCRYWATEVSAWPRGQTVRLEIHYRLATAINDGQNSYPAGDYYQVIYATVR